MGTRLSYWKSGASPLLTAVQYNDVLQKYMYVLHFVKNQVVIVLFDFPQNYPFKYPFKSMLINHNILPCAFFNYYWIKMLNNYGVNISGINILYIYSFFAYASFHSIQANFTTIYYLWTKIDRTYLYPCTKVHTKFEMEMFNEFWVLCAIGKKDIQEVWTRMIIRSPPFPTGGGQK